MEDILNNFESFKTLANINPNLIVYGKSLLCHARTTEQIIYLMNTGKLDLTIEDNLLIISESDVHKIKILIDSKFNMKLVNRIKNTFLHYAESSEIIKLLLNIGLNINSKNLLGKTPLHTTIFRYTENYDVVKTLIENGADINENDNHQKTPICYTHNFEIVKLLIENGANVNHKDSQGNTLLHHIEDDIRNLKLIELLLQNGAYINIKNKYGQTPKENNKYTGKILKLIETYDKDNISF